MKKLLCFDMDGTIADLYAVDGWLEKLRNEDATPYRNARPMWDTEQLKEILKKLQQNGYEIAIITWLSKNSSEDFKKATRNEKLAWLEAIEMPFDYFHGIQYGTTKADAVRNYLPNYESATLFNDNAKVRKGWHYGETVNPEEIDIVNYLARLLD